jgi:Protein of unknown function (DUF1566)/Viral BACON domain
MIKKWVSIFCLIFLMVTTVVWAKPDSAYIDNGNGTVTDIETKLMWQQRTDENDMDWYYATSNYCPGLSLAGYKDWRLPTLDELKTLVDLTQRRPTINHMFFPNTVSSVYWSSTTDAGYTDDAWGVDFNGGYDYSNDRDGSYYVRAVRGGQSGSLDNLVISPLSQTVTTDAGSTSFGVSNTGTGIIPWKASVTAGADWLSISSRAEGTNTGTITCAYTANTSTSSRTGTIRVTVYGDGTQKDVTVNVIQDQSIGGGVGPPTPTACTATIDGNLLLHIPYLLSGTLSRWADLVNVFDPTLILFKLTNYGIIENPSFSCKASTLSGDFKIIHIPDVLLPDGITHLWVDLEYSQAFSTDTNVYFEVKSYGIISN